MRGWEAHKGRQLPGGTASTGGALSEPNLGARSEPTTAAGLARSSSLGVPEEVEGGTRQQSIPWRRRHPRHEPAPFAPTPSSRPPVPPGRAHSTCRRLRTAAMFKIKLEPLKMTAWTMNVFVKFR